ncbi:Protein kinase domain-containing protein ppk32, variant 2 [Entomophthora muscae]|nr:Protein kinase domain-containing protein ppk32, variant 2 [Entomophthora muscae]
MFASEPLQICLSNLLSHDLSVGTDYQLDALEIQKGLLQLTKALQFCHNDAKLVHGNITPNSLFVTPEGDWKLGGFGFSTYVQYTNEEAGQTAYFEHDSSLPSSFQQNLDYAAPEFVLDHRCCFEGDIFSLGCLIYAVFNSGRTLLKTRNNLLTYRNQVDRLSTLPLDDTPQYFEAVIRRLVCRDPSGRPSATSLEGSPAFDNILVKTMRFLETIAEHPLDQKMKFFQGLKDVLPKFPERLLLKKILPALLEETKATELLSHTLPNIVLIADKLTSREFSELAVPTLRVAFSAKGPPSALASLLDCLGSFVPKTSSADFRDYFLPCVYSSLDSHDPTLQDKVLSTIPSFVDQLDYTVVKNSLYPKIQALYVRTNLLSIKVGVLQCFHSLLKVLDKTIILEKLVPLLQNTRTKEPGVQLSMLAIYQELGIQYLDAEATACKIMPELWKISTNPLLTISQFQKLMSSITLLSQKLQKDLSNRIRSTGNLNRSVSQQNGSKSASPLDFESIVKGSSPQKSAEVSLGPNKIDQRTKTSWDNSKFKDSSPLKLSPDIEWQDMFNDEIKPIPHLKIEPATVIQPFRSPAKPKPKPHKIINPTSSQPMTLKPPEKKKPYPSSDWEMFDPLL